MVEFLIKPYEWQERLYSMSMNIPNIAVLADMGTGKTAGMINVLRGRYAFYGGIKKTLIISPLVTLFNWKKEIQKYSKIPATKIHVLHGNSAKKLKLFQRAIEENEAQIIVCNYETLISDVVMKHLLSWAPSILVLDEAHMVKNHKAQRSKKALMLAEKAQHKYIMTGTPMANSLTDIFMQYKILDNGATFGTNFYTFQRTYMYDANQAWAHKQNYFPKWIPRAEKLDELQAKIYTKAIRATKEECLDLPPLVQEVYEVELSPKQRKYYDEMEKEFITYVAEKEKSGVVVAQLALTKALRLQQIVTGFLKLDDGTEIEIDDNPRLDALEELIMSLHEKHKVIVWCSFSNNYKQIGKMLDKNKVKYVRITGEETLLEKEAAQDAFRDDPEVRVAVCNRKAAGIGINLVSASYAVTFSRTFSLTEELQGRDRNYRGGAEIHEKITKIDLCAADTIDEEVTKSLVDKKEISDRVIEIVKRRNNAK